MLEHFQLYIQRWLEIRTWVTEHHPNTVLRSTCITYNLEFELNFLYLLSFQVVETLRRSFPHLSRDTILSKIDVIRKKNNGTMTGLTVGTIAEKIRQLELEQGKSNICVVSSPCCSELVYAVVYKHLAILYYSIRPKY